MGRSDVLIRQRLRRADVFLETDLLPVRSLSYRVLGPLEHMIFWDDARYNAEIRENFSGLSMEFGEVDLGAVLVKVGDEIRERIHA